MGSAASLGAGFLGVDGDMRWNSALFAARLCVPSVAWWAKVQPDPSKPLTLRQFREHLNLPQAIAGALAPSAPQPVEYLSLWQRLLACFTPRDRAKERSLLGGRASPRLIMESAMTVPEFAGPMLLKAKVHEAGSADRLAGPCTGGAAGILRLYGAA